MNIFVLEKREPDALPSYHAPGSHHSVHNHVSKFSVNQMNEMANNNIKKRSLVANILKSGLIHFENFQKIGINSDRLLLGIILNCN